MPKMSDVFKINEASMRAFQMAGWQRPEAKAYFEKEFGPAALEVAIIMAAVVDNHEDDDYTMDELLGDPQIERVIAALKESEKFRKVIRNNQPVFKSMKARGDIAGVWATIHEFANQFIVRPDTYGGSPTSINLEKVAPGWEWVELEGKACYSYEGQKMQHCGKAEGRMFSLRDPSGNPHVTLDLAGPEGSDFGPFRAEPGSIIQLRGKQNAVPDRKYWPAIKQLVTQWGVQNIYDYERQSDAVEGTDLVKYLGIEAPLLDQNPTRDENLRYTIYDRETNTVLAQDIEDERTAELEAQSIALSMDHDPERWADILYIEAQD